jgi:hypothetical protein
MSKVLPAEDALVNLVDLYVLGGALYAKHGTNSMSACPQGHSLTASLPFPLVIFVISVPFFAI